jgi:hypothetical protein
LNTCCPGTFEIERCGAGSKDATCASFGTVEFGTCTDDDGVFASDAATVCSAVAGTLVWAMRASTPVDAAPSAIALFATPEFAIVSTAAAASAVG